MKEVENIKKMKEVENVFVVIMLIVNSLCKFRLLLDGIYFTLFLGKTYRKEQLFPLNHEYKLFL